MFKPFDLKGKAALVTGGNGGIGLGLAEGLAQAGADVVIWGTNPEKNQKAKAKLAVYGTRVEAHVVDVSKEENVVAGMERTLKDLGRLDACFANAGAANVWNSFLDMGGEDYRRVMSINLDGQIWTMREACRHMQKRAEAGDPGGAVVCVASMVANFGAPRNQDYGATKAAIINVVKGIAVEFARHGVRANAILPGWVATGMTDHLQESDVFTRKVISRVPMRRWGRPEEFSGIAVYLASDASSFHSGDAILIDGAYSAY